MHATAAPNHWKRIALPVLCIALLCVCLLQAPWLAMPLAFLMPVIVCPAQVRVGSWFSLLLPLLPCAGSLLAGGDLLLSLLLLPCSYGSLLLTSRARRSKLSFSLTALLLVGVALVTNGLWWARVMDLYEGDLFSGLANQTVQNLASLPSWGNWLYQMVALGVLPLPAAYAQTAGFRLGDLIFLNPALQTELLNALRFQLYSFLRQAVPQLLVQGSLLVGVCAALRTAKAIGKNSLPPISIVFRSGSHEIQRSIAAYPQFRNLRLPASYRNHALFLGLAGFVTLLFDGEFSLMLGSLLVSAFTGVFSLLGAAVLVFWATRRGASAGIPGALLAAGLALVFPTGLLVVGLLDQFMDLRLALLNHSKGGMNP